MLEIMIAIDQARGAAFDHQFEAAAAQATRVLDRLPGCLLALRILAWAQLEQEDDAALATFERCAAFDPEDALAYVGQAIWCQQRAQRDAALGHWIRAWELDPHNQAIRRALVRLTGELPESTFADAIGLLRGGREDDAAGALRHVQLERSDPAVDLALADALWAVGQQRAAFELAAAIYARQGQSVKAALYVAAQEYRAGRRLHSREAIARAEQADPGLIVFADVVRQVGLQAAVDHQRACRPPLTTASRSA